MENTAPVWKDGRDTIEHDCCAAYIGAGYVFTPALALHSTRWWGRCRRQMEKEIAQ